MITAWTKHIKDPEEKQRFESSIIHAKHILDRQLTILDEMEADTTDLELNPKVYDIPNWDYRAADLNGYKRALRHVKKLITLDQKDTHDRQPITVRPGHSTTGSTKELSD